MVLTRKQTKRRKTLEVSLGTLGIVGKFPDDVLRNVASYLPKTAAALFATLFSDPNDEAPSSTSVAILSAFEKEDWETIDFMDCKSALPPFLWMKLKYDDIRGILHVIDAKNRLKSLELPLVTSSGALASVWDLASRGRQHEGNGSQVPPGISGRDVRSIIENMLLKKNHSLERISIPKNLLKERKEFGETIGDFVEKHKRKLGMCGDCNSFFCIGSASEGRLYCMKCGDKFCICRRCVEGGGYSCVQHPCDICHRNMCEECSGGLRCIAGGAMACNECTAYMYDQMSDY